MPEGSDRGSGLGLGLGLGFGLGRVVVFRERGGLETQGRDWYLMLSSSSAVRDVCRLEILCLKMDGDPVGRITGTFN